MKTYLSNRQVDPGNQVMGLVIQSMCQCVNVPVNAEVFEQTGMYTGRRFSYKT
jgi:hypothetical protein